MMLMMMIVIITVVIVIVIIIVISVVMVIIISEVLSLPCTRCLEEAIETALLPTFAGSIHELTVSGNLSLRLLCWH